MTSAGLNSMLATRFPPSFEGNPWAYGFALFSLTLISAISFSMIVGYALEARRQREIDRLTRNLLAQPTRAMLSPITLYRLIVSGLLMTILFGALPDVVVMLAWGEAEDPTMWLFLQIDRVFDGLTLAPFTIAIYVAVRAAQAVDHRLAVDNLQISLRPSWSTLRDKLKILGLVLLIAIGVTLYKAHIR